MFDALTSPAPDALHGIMDAFRADRRDGKIDLGVGMYRDAAGRCPVMEVVRSAEAKLYERQDSKGYLPLAGAPSFVEGLLRVALGEDHPARLEGRVAAIQVPGGTGALFLGASLTRRANEGAKALVGAPTWPSHPGVLGAAGLEVATYGYLAADGRSASREHALDTARRVEAGDLFLMHGPCHNPTGLDLAPEVRAEVLSVLDERGGVPMLDVAYAGLGEGLEADFNVVRQAMRRRRALVALSCSKSFGLYRERTGLLMVACADAAERETVQRTLEAIGRATWSMAPAHGAEVVGTILANAELEAAWRAELDTMRVRVAKVRARLATVSSHPALEGIRNGRGIFTVLPLSTEEVTLLAERHAVYMAPSGRINVAGFKTGDEERFASALADL